jgi:hypothetical protein
MATEREQALIDAVLDWSAERSPNDPGDARLMKAIMTFEGDHTEPCEGCDGDCGEACAPITVGAAHRMYDNFIDDWNCKHGVIEVRKDEFRRARDAVLSGAEAIIREASLSAAKGE